MKRVDINCLNDFDNWLFGVKENANIKCYSKDNVPYEYPCILIYDYCMGMLHQRECHYYIIYPSDFVGVQSEYITK